MNHTCRNSGRLLVSVGALAAWVAAASACGTLLPIEGEVADPASAAIDVVATGGIAALVITTHVDSASGAFTYTMGPICQAGSTCQVNYHREGTLSRASVDELFLRTRQPDFRALRADYGATRNAADMMEHRVIIRTGGLRRSIVADDGTMPTLMAQFVHDIAALVLPSS